MYLHVSASNFYNFLLFVLKEFGHKPPDWLKEIPSSSGI